MSDNEINSWEDESFIENDLDDTENSCKAGKVQVCVRIGACGKYKRIR